MNINISNMLNMFMYHVIQRVVLLGKTVDDFVHKTTEDLDGVGETARKF